MTNFSATMCQILETASTDKPEQKILPTKKSKADKKPRSVSKQQMIINLLSRKEGATSQQLQAAIGWQKHSVRGAMSNMQKKLNIIIKATQTASGERVYKIGS